MARPMCWWLAPLVMACIFGPGCRCSKQKDSKVTFKMSKSGLGFRLSNADDDADSRKPRPVAPSTALSSKDVERVLARVKPITEDPNDVQDYATRGKSIPAPRAGQTLTVPFPVAVSTPPAAAASGPLTLLRHAPEGDVTFAPFLSATFSRPMVALTSVADLARARVPLKVTPQPKGEWRWVGAQTVVFQPLERFPMATEYRVEVLADAQAPGGERIDKGYNWSFSTPTVSVISSYPDSASAQPLEPIVFLGFDQKIDPAAVLSTIQVKAGEGVVAMRLAQDEEIEKDDQVRPRWNGTLPDRRMALKPVAPLSQGATVEVRVGPGTPSAEGPLRTTKEHSFKFRTYGALHVVSVPCHGRPKGECVPLDPFAFQFSNGLESDAFEPSMVKVEPAVESMHARVSGQYLHISGRTRGRTKYKVTLSAKLTDMFGQKLGRDEAFEVAVGDSEPYFHAEHLDNTVLDPSGPPEFPVYTINHSAIKVSLYAVGPEHYERWTEYTRTWDTTRKQKTPPGKQVFSQTVKVREAPDELVRTGIDLRPALQDGVGHVIIEAEPSPKPPKETDVPTMRAWVQVTNIGLDVVGDNAEYVGWATSLRDGAPLEGVEISLYPGGQPVKTGADGLAKLAAGAGSTLVARKGADWAMLRGWYTQDTKDKRAWFVFDDRKLYKPKETVRVKGWIRRVGMHKGGDVGAEPGIDGTSISWTAVGNRREELAKGKVTCDRNGGFDFKFDLPDGANLGNQSHVVLTYEGSERTETHTHYFQIQEFRRPEFEVTATTEPGPHVVGEHALATVQARYYAGGGLGNAEVSWTVDSRAQRYTPPDRGEFSFGPIESFGWLRRPKIKAREPETWKSRTDASGDHRLRIDFDALEDGFPRSINLTGTVQDVNRQAWTGSSSLIVHPSEVYVGLRSPRTFVREGEAVPVEFITTDIDGKALPQRRVTVRYAREEWRSYGPESKPVESDVQNCEMLSADQPQKCEFKAQKSGFVRLSAAVEDDSGRRSRSELRLWVSGADSVPDSRLDKDKLTLVLDKPEYRPGDTAQILIISPFPKAEGLLTLERLGVVKTERFSMASAVHTLKVPIEDGVYPGLRAEVLLATSAPRLADNGDVDKSLPARPAFGRENVSIPVPPGPRTLKVVATPREKSVAPGASTVIDIEVKTATGAPAAASEIAVAVVDDSLLALADYKQPDPVAVFYPERYAFTNMLNLRTHLYLQEKELLRGGDLSQIGVFGHGTGTGTGQGFGSGHGRLTGSAKGAASAAPGAWGRGEGIGLGSIGATGGRPESLEFASIGPLPGPGAPPGTPITVRSDFSALAAWVPKQPTDAQGEAQVPVKLPDNLTRYRIIVFATAGEREFGSGEASLTARLPLMVRPSAPRFLNFGDRFEFPITVQNQTEKELEVDVAARASNAELTGTAGRRVTVPAKDRVEVRIPAAAAKPGRARFQIVAATKDFADAAEVDLPTWTPATSEAFATYGVIDDGVMAQPVAVPSNVVRGVGGLEVTLSSTNLHALTDAVVYLVQYPFDCNEQIASRVLALAALKDVLSAFKAKGLPSRPVLESSVARDMERLSQRQSPAYSGWDYWRKDRMPVPYVTIHVMHALQRAKDKKFEVPGGMVDRGMTYLRRIEQNFPSYYGIQERRALTAYALYVRARWGEKDAARARTLIEESGGVEATNLEVLGWLMPVLSGDSASEAMLQAIRKHLANRVTETAGAAHFVTSYEDGGHTLLHSDRRADAILLESLIGDNPQSDLIPKLVTGLLAHRNAGHWLSTQENAWVLVALDKYFQTYEKATPDFVARGWLGELYGGDHQFRGYSTDRLHFDIPMQQIAEAKGGALTLQKEGAGRLYYRVGMQYALSDLRPPPVERGFSVDRKYEPVDDPQDVKRDNDGVWHMKAGSRIRVRVTMVAASRRYQVALIDPIPAGLEPINPALAGMEPIPDADPGKARPKDWWGRSWYEHQNLRDERVEAFTSMLWEGEYEYTYVARATIPGVFVVPPPKAEEMYNPETFGRGAGDKVIVE